MWLIGVLPTTDDPLGKCQGFRVPLIGCSEGIWSNIAAAGLLAFVGVGYALLKRHLDHRVGRTDFGPAEAEVIRGRVRSDWIEPCLQRSVAGELLTVPIAPAADLIEHDKDQRSIGKRISDLGALLDKTNGRVLVAGNGASGKTVFAMQLAKLLDQRSVANANAPVPLVLSVSSFATEGTRDVDKWIASQAERLYGIKAKRAARLLRASRFALVLDGLDEVRSEQARVSFLESLNTILISQPALAVVLTCRREDLPDDRDARARLRHAVIVQPLTEAQVRNRLSELAEEDDDWQAISSAVGANPAALAALSSPLYLDLLSTGQAADISAVARSSTEDAARGSIAEAFINRCITKLGSDAEPSLTYVAECLMTVTSTDSAVFHIDEIVDFRLNSRLAFGLVWGMTSGLGVGLGYGLSSGLGSGLGVGLGYGLVFGLIERRPNPAASAPSPSLQGLVSLLAIGVAYGLVLGIAVGLVVGILLVPTPIIRIAPEPRSAARRRWRSLPLHWIAPGVGLALDRLATQFRSVGADDTAAGWHRGFFGDRPIVFHGRGTTAYLLYTDRLAWLALTGAVGGIVFGTWIWLNFGGWFAVNQWLVGRNFRSEHLFPGGVVDFLDRAATTGIVRRVGPGWQFRHRDIQELLAARAEGPLPP